MSTMLKTSLLGRARSLADRLDSSDGQLDHLRDGIAHRLDRTRVDIERVGRPNLTSTLDARPRPQTSNSPQLGSPSL